MSIHSEVVRDVRRYRRQVVGVFMDEHPGIFHSPAVAPSWVDFFSQNDEVLGLERLAVEKALGMFAQMFRHAQHTMLSNVSMRLDEFLSSDNFPEINEILTPDPVALLIVSGEDSNDHTPEIVAFARMISVFKFLVQSGAVSADHIFESMCRGLDDLSSGSVLQRSLVDAIKQMVQRDLEIMLCDESEVARSAH
jgi:hypothetical protein